MVSEKTEELPTAVFLGRVFRKMHGAHFNARTNYTMMNCNYFLSFQVYLQKLNNKDWFGQDMSGENVSHR